MIQLEYTENQAKILPKALVSQNVSNIQMSRAIRFQKSSNLNI